MRHGQKLVVIGALILIAVILAGSFLHFGDMAVIDPGYPFITFGDDGLYWGVFAASGIPMEEAVILGMVVPILLFAGGGYVLAGMRSRVRA